MYSNAPLGRNVAAACQGYSRRQVSVRCRNCGCPCGYTVPVAREFEGFLCGPACAAEVAQETEAAK